MDALDLHKVNEESFIKMLMMNFSIVSYGYISAIDFNTVTVNTIVNRRPNADKIKCVFMNLGNEFFSLNLKPALNMRVVVFAPSKGASGMYENEATLVQQKGKSFITEPSPFIHGTQACFCIPVLRSTAQSLSSIIIDDVSMIGEFKQKMMHSLFESVELDIYADTNIELHEDTSHFRGCYGDMEETFGMVQGANGTEKSGTYVYKETYGKYSSVEKNLESGITANIGKAYATPFLDDPGALEDVPSAPVNINLGTKAPVTLTFGESAVVVKASTTNGIDIDLTGSLPVNITAATGKLTFKNNAGSLKDVLDKIADLFTNMTTIGPNVVPAVPYTAAASPATTALALELKALAASIFE